MCFDLSHLSEYLLPIPLKSEHMIRCLNLPIAEVSYVRQLDLVVLLLVPTFCKFVVEVEGFTQIHFSLSLSLSDAFVTVDNTRAAQLNEVNAFY